MKARSQSKAGNPIRRPPPPDSGVSYGESSSGYASSSEYSSGASSSNYGDGVDMQLPASGTSRSPYSPSSEASERARIARIFLALACLWPLLFLLIPPSSTHSHVALLSVSVVVHWFSSFTHIYNISHLSLLLFPAQLGRYNGRAEFIAAYETDREADVA